MIFKPLSDALGLALALTMTAPSDKAPTHNRDHSTAETRWGTLAVVPAQQPGEGQTVTLNGAPVAGLTEPRLWIVTVEPVSPEADRAVIGAALAPDGPPTRFRAVTIGAIGAHPEPGGLELTLRQHR